MPVTTPSLGSIGATLAKLASAAGFVGGIAPGSVAKTATIASTVLGWAAQLAQAGIDPEIQVKRIQGQHSVVQEALDKADAEQARLAAGGTP